MRVKLKKLTALLLSISMVLSMFTDLLPAGYAAEGGVSTHAEETDQDYNDIVGTRQPGLYIDFLGDNRKYLPETSSPVASGLAAPGLVDQNAKTNPGDGRTWEGYKDGEKDDDGYSLYGDIYSGKDTIFWIGVGMDKINEFDLFRQEEELNAPDGVYSLELGFYYDNRYIEPYIGPNTSYSDSPEAVQQAYEGVIRQANLGDSYPEYRWAGYHVVSAETGLMPQTDPVTQETLEVNKSAGYGPNMEGIMSGEGGNNWRMTYVAIERDSDKTDNRSFTEDEREDTKYLLIIPFRLKSHDAYYRTHLCLRLARNAGMFSIGGGEDGSYPYAAWERTTVRNPGRELKLMANFRGDLNIFNGQRVQDELYVAGLYLDNGGGSGNTARLSVDGDPSSKKVDLEGQSLTTRYIRNLPAGTGMKIDITVQTGYEATVSVYSLNDENKPVADRNYIIAPFIWDEAKGSFSFVMPAEDVLVDVRFAITDNTIFNLYLDEDRDGEEPVKKSEVTGNDTVLKAHYPGNPTPPPPATDPIPKEDVTVTKHSPVDPNLNLPREKVTIEAPDPANPKTSLEVEISLHKDYYAEVEIYQISTGSNIQPDNDPEPWFSVSTTNNNVVTVTSDGVLEVKSLPQSDMIVRVRYLLANRVTGILEVWHQAPAPVKDSNVAQLRTLGYDDDNRGMPAYSGVVYQDDRGTEDTTADDNHSAVKSKFDVLERVEAQAALLSGSLGGDGNTPVPWMESGTPAAPDPGSMMAVLYSATSKAELAGKINAYDLRKLDNTGLTKGPGLRKNSDGDYYADSEMGDFFDRLLEIKALAEAEFLAAAGSATPSGVRVVDVLDPNDPGKTLFSYYDLTPDQIQAYLLDYEKADTAAAVSALALRSDTDAKTVLPVNWYDPTADNGTRPPSMPDPLDNDNGCKLETRVGREMAVVLEASSVYTMVDKVLILDAEAYYDPVASVETEIATSAQDPDYKNVYLFTVPNKDYVVKVIYKEREADKLNLSITIPVGDEETGNVTTVTAFAPDPDKPAARKVVKSKYTEGVEPVAVETDRILVGSTVTVLVRKIPGYKASARVVTQPGSGAVNTSLANMTDLADGTVFTFYMPAAESTEIQITYTRDVELHNAYLIVAGDTSGGAAQWEGTNSMVKSGVPQGDALRGEITVEPGYYIASVEAYTAANAYPFTLSGNGWNNGAGGVVTVDTVMPDQEYYVRITFAKGPPPEEDLMALTLQVVDPDNATPYVDNFAQAQAGTVTLGPVGLAPGRTGPFVPPLAGTVVAPGSAQPDTKTVKAGERVTVEYEVQNGFALDSIVVEPAALGVTPTYMTGAGNKVRAQFTMPSASARVIVTFRKTENIKTRLFLDLNKTENGTQATETSPGVSGNTVTWVKSDTFDRNTGLTDGKFTISSIPATVPRRDDTSMTTGVARPGENVSFNVQVASGWYVHSLTLTDGQGSRLSYSLSAPDPVSGERVASFIMPSSDVTAIVNYRQGTPPDPDDPKDTDSDRLLELVVLDPDNTGSGDPVVYADNWAKAEVSGVTAAILGELGLYRGVTRSGAYVKPGDQVTIHYDAVEPGYTLEVITVTSDGTPSTISPIYLDPDTTTPGKATFTMPDANVSAVVRFRAVTKDKPVQKYTANLILHMPTGVDPADYDKVGEGSFVYDVYDLNNKSYSRTALPGETIDFTAWAKDGYYIQRVSVTPAALGVSAAMSGAFGLQDGAFVMPAANVEVNVFFVKLDKDKEWPKEVPYSLNLEVYDASSLGSTANFENIAGNPLAGADRDLVHSGGRKELSSYDVGGTQTFIRERDRVTVTLNPAEGAYVRSVTVTDSRGRSVAWSYVPGGIAFDMPPAHVTVTVHYARRTDEIDEGRKHKVTLHIIDNKLNDFAQIVLDSDTLRVADDHLEYIDELFAGDTLTLTATPDSAAVPHHSVVSAYVVMRDSSGGAPVVIPTTGLLPSTATTQTGMPLVPTGGQVRFAMPDADADVYVTFIDGGIPEPDERTGSLMVVGPTGSGSAKMTATAGSKDSTDDVFASGGGVLFAPEGTELTVDLDVKSGYAISSIRVMDRLGNDIPYTWTTDGSVAPQTQFKLAMAPSGVQVYVELEEVDVTKVLTVQVVVNNGGGAGNTAKLRKEPTTEGNGVAILSPVHALDEIFLDLEVQTGYRIASIQVVPAKFGIAPSLTKKDTEKQTTSFIMPGEDVVVYVHFAADNRTRYRATLVTEGHYNDDNRAKIHSLFSGWSDEVSPNPSTYTGGADTTSVLAAPATATDPAEWVTVDYTWGADSSVESITVTLNDGTSVPFTQNITDMTNRKGEITFPMAEGNVTVTVKYRKDPNPVGYQAVIHVIDLDNNTEITDHSWGKLTWTDQTTGNVMATIFPGNRGEITVPAGQTVTVEANTSYPEGNGVYIWAGYVLYRQGGQMINFNFKPDTPGPGFSGDKTAKFVMHPGQNDVYIYFSKRTPNDKDFSAVLMVDSPAGDTASKATMWTESDENSPGPTTTTVVANMDPPDDHGYIIASNGDEIKVLVEPAPGYAIDSVLMTPLGVSDEYGVPIVPVLTGGNTYTFTMPSQNVAIRVKLKTSSAGEYTATLHYASADTDDDTFDMSMAKAILYYDQGRTDINDTYLKVNENTQMSLDVCINNSDYLVLAAYVLRPNGAMVPLSKALEGTTDTEPGKDAVDGGATFLMPASDVDVYVWFTKEAPAENWRTAVLTVTDKKGTLENSGDNSARFWSLPNHPDKDENDEDYETLPHYVKSEGVPGHGFFWVEEGDTVKIKINEPADGYIFSREATITHSVSGVGDIMGLPDTSKAPEYVYTYTVGPYNSAVHAHFVASDLVQKPLDVKVIDGDNPGNGTVTNIVNVRPAGKTPLNVESTTSAGARQRVPDVREGTLISFTVYPDKIPGSDPEERYVAVARWINKTTGAITSLALTPQGDGSYAGTAFDMPGAPATLEVTFYKAWKVELSVTHTDAVSGTAPAPNRDSVAQLEEKAFNTTITAMEGDPLSSRTVTVPNATALEASMQTLNANVEVAGVLLKRSGRVDRPLYPDVDDIYRHTLSRSDVEIQFILSPKTENENDRTYIASVSAANKPAGVVDPEIHVTSAAGRTEGPGWTEAKKTDQVAVTLKVPYGYKAVVTSGDVTLDGTPPVEVDGPANEGDADVTGTATFTMPAKNVHVTVRYVKTRFTAKIVVAGNGRGTATWDAGSIVSTTAVMTGSDVVRNLMKGNTLDFTATPDPGSRIGSIMVSYGTYIPGSPSAITDTVTMPEDDVVVTVVFTKERTQGYHLDLHVSGTAGGTATLDAGTAGRLQSTPGLPVGFSRLEGVESGNEVTLTVTPGADYTVVVSYYLYNNGSLTEIDSFTPNPDGTVTFHMPATNTCIYVTFRKGENPDPNDPNKYLDLHVSGTGGGSASLTTGETTPRSIGSTPTNPKSVSTLRPVEVNTPVTLKVKPETGYTAIVTYYVYHNGEPKPVALTEIPATGTGEDGVTFPMPDQSTCVYVTFRAEKDSMHYLDLHVTNPKGGTAILATDGQGTLTSTPAAPQTYGQLKPVEDGTPVTLTVAPGVDYTVTVSYYRHDGKNLYYTSYLIDTDDGGVATFDMPGANTCIYVKFNGPGDDPDPDPDAKYLDLHVSGTGGGRVTLTPDGMTAMASTPSAPNSYDQRKPVPEGTNVTLEVEVLPDYTASISSYVHGTGGTVTFTPATSILTAADGRQTYTFTMPATSTCVYVTFKHIDDRDDESRRYLDLHVTNPAGGSAVLTARSAADSSIIGSVSSTPANPVSGLQRIEPLPDGVPVGSPVTLDVGPLTDGYTVTVSYAVGSGGTLTYKTYTIDSTSGGTATFDMPTRSTCVYVTFQKPTVPPEPDPEPDPDPEEYIAFVVTTGAVGSDVPANAAQDIVNQTDPAKIGGAIWRYGEGGDSMLVTFTTEPGYIAIVTAKRMDDNTSVPVVQLGTTLVGTASLNMPGGTDVQVTIEYVTELPPSAKDLNLTLRLVGHDDKSANMGELSGGAATLALSGQDGPAGPTKAKAGDHLYLDAGWAEKYRIRRITVTSGGVTTDLNWNEYLRTATSDFFMPDADALVTVYFNSFYKATLFVIDADRKDFLNGGAADTAGLTVTNVPDTSLEVFRAGASVGFTTSTHTPIEDLYGDERVTTTVDLGDLPTGTKVASVIATTPAGTVNLTETATGSGIYHYDMSTATREPDDVDVTVVLSRDDEDLYIATVYKVGHDNRPGNTATITNTTTPTGLPKGTIWTGAYENDLLRVDVNTEPGYYAVVTAVEAGTTTPVPVLQWTAVGPFDAQFYMPAANVDVTVTYSTTPPEATLTLRLEGHGQKAGNEGSVYNMTTAPGTLIPNLTLKGTDAPDTDPIEIDSVSKVVGGTDLEVRSGVETGYSIKSITMTVPGFAPITLAVSATNTATTRMPVLTGANKALITVIFEEGVKSPRPFDPEHSKQYNKTYYPKPANPDLSTTPAGEEGWILAGAKEEDRAKGKIVVTIPTLYEHKGDTHTLYDAGVDKDSTEDPKPVPPVYTFYWLDDLGAYRELVKGTDIKVIYEASLSYVENDKGHFPTPSNNHYGYTFTLEAIAASGSPFASYVEDGGTIFVTATRPNENESLMTQVVIPVPDYTATLHIVDLSSSLGNMVELSVQGDASYTPVTTDGGKIEKLHGKETLQTDVTKGDDDVKVVSVLAIPKKGSPTYLPVDMIVDPTSTYLFPMVRDDVDIVVTLANGEDELYTATVVKEDPDNEPGNRVEISNQTHPVLNRDTGDPKRWTLGYPGDEIQVDATAALGYRAKVKAEIVGGTLDGTLLDVTPAGGAGTMVITLDDGMPAANVKITVTFEKVEQANQSWVTLRMRMDSETGPLPIDPDNLAEGSASGTVALTANAVNGYTEAQLLTGVSSLDVLATLAPGYGVKGWYVNGAPQSAPGTNVNATISIPTSGITNTIITVVLEETKVEDRTPRPFDPAHSVRYPNATDYAGPGGHQDGYLLADNQGNSLVEITVPNLYDGGLYAAENVVYTLYAKVGGAMVKLEEGTDYDTVKPVAAVGYTHTATGTDEWTGQVFTIKSLDPTGVLGDYVKNGGVIYITARRSGEAKPGVPWTESAYTEVVIPADPKKDEGGYKATLRVIDDTNGGTTNHVKMQNANNSTDPAATVPWDTGDPVYPTEAGHIDELLGGELIRTEVEPDSRVTYTVMSYTGTMGNVLLFPDPTGTDRYRKTMPTEDMDIIVHFRNRNEHIHIAAVEKRGATAVDGNDADIRNATDSTLNSDRIWTEGRCAETSTEPQGDKIQVEVTTAEGYYATVTMSYMDPVLGRVDRTMIILGSGNPTPLVVEFDMPDADVQVVVLFEAGNRSPRPYDPKHSETYYGDEYQHYTDASKTTRTPENQSTTDQEGWLLGDNLGGGKAIVTIPTLWSEKDGLENADKADFTFYLKDEATGGYIRLTEGKDYTLADADPADAITGIYTPVRNTYQDAPGSAGSHDYDGVKFMLLEEADGLLEGLLDAGLSLFVSATKREAAVPPWVEGEVTELVIPSTGLRPYDPDRVNSADEEDPTYEDHWIRAENRGDYLIVTVPLLNSPNEDDPTEVDGTKHRFQLHLQVDGEKWKDDISGVVNVTSLLKITNVNGYDHPSNVNTLYDPDWTGNVAPTYLYEPNYENEIYNDTYLKSQWGEDEEKWHGARFVVEILTNEEIEALGLDVGAETAALANAKILREIFDNEGTMSADPEKQSHRMYITSDETVTVADDLPDFRAMDYVDFEVPQYYTLAGIVESYAPQHIATFSLYPLVERGDDPDPDPDAPAGQHIGVNDIYGADPAFVYRQFRDNGTGLWQLDFDIKSSELLGDDRLGVTYKLVIEKAGHITFTWRALELSKDTTDLPDALTFTVAAWDEEGNVDADSRGVIALYGGDINNDGFVRVEDYTMLMSFISGKRTQNKGSNDSATNPDSLTYRADLDGDGAVRSKDVAIWNNERNYNKKARDYARPELQSTAQPITVTMLEDEVLLEELEALLPEEEELPTDLEEGQQPEEGETPPAEAVPDESETGEKSPAEGEEEPDEAEASGTNEGVEPPEKEVSGGSGTEEGSGETAGTEDPQGPEQELEKDPDTPNETETSEERPDQGRKPSESEDLEGPPPPEGSLQDSSITEVEIIPEETGPGSPESDENTRLSEDIT